jgi:single-strand DNA-binding protein
MPSLNQVTMMGNLTRDVQLSYTPNQTAVADFGLAVNRKWTGDDGHSREDVCFLDCRAFGKLAGNIDKYMKKGSLLLVCGYLVFEQWEKKDGTKHSKHRLTVERAQFLPSANGQSHDTPHEGIPAGDIPF